MHFREKGGQIQFIRTTYDPETKRSKYNLVGGMRRATLEVKPAILARLTEEEKAEVDAFIEAQKNGGLLEGQLYAHKLPHIVAMIEDYVVRTEGPERDLLMGHMLRAALEFQAVVRKG